MLWLFSSDSHTVQKTPWPREHLLSLLQSTPCWNSNHKSWYSVSLTSNYYLWVTTLNLVVLKSYSDWSKHSDPMPIKYEKSFVSHHIKSDKGLFWKSTKMAKAAKGLNKKSIYVFSIWLHCDYSKSLTLSIVSKLSWSWIPTNDIQVQTEKENIVTTCSPPPRKFREIVVQGWQGDVPKKNLQKCCYDYRCSYTGCFTRGQRTNIILW